MTDEHGTDPRPDPAQDAHLRALLAELGSGPDGEPMPPHVADRLDDTLARLVAERAKGGAKDHAGDDAGDDAGTVVPLRRRWLPRASAAAAAVIVLGAGGVAVANLLGNGSGSDMSAGSSAEDRTAAKSAPGAMSSDAGGSATRESAGDAAALPEVSSASFAADVARLLERRTSLITPDEKPSVTGGTPLERGGGDKQGPTDGQPAPACPGPPVADPATDPATDGATDGATRNPIRYDGRPAVLLVHPVRDGRQLVEAWSCAGDRRLAAATLTR
jgi:hypothetical protein